MTTSAVELQGIEKRFPGVVANHDVNMRIAPSTVHAVIGENGAGKSTLMKILYGVQKPDAGTIQVDGEVVSFSSPSDAIAHGIGMVFQHFMLADNLTVLENVVLGAEKLHGTGAKARAEVRAISERFGFHLDPDVLVESLGVASRQRLEILKVLYRGAKIIILDEPTAVLVPQEVEALFANLEGLKAEGHTILFISHKLDEVLSIADAITVLRRGTTVGHPDPSSATKRQLAELMVGSELPSPATEESTVTETVQLSVEDLTMVDEFGRTVLEGINLQIHRGEVLGIAGVEGNGQNELVEGILAMRPATGRVRLGDEDMSRWGTRRRRAAGVGYIPEDRHRHGLLLDSPLWENRVLGHTYEDVAVKGGWINRGGSRRDAERIVEQYDVRTPGIDTMARALSGGNQQKFIVGRELSGEPSLLIASHPTRGVDVGAQAAIWDQIKDARRAGLAVLLISADLDELIGLSDRIEVILRGRLVGTFDPRTVTPQDLGEAMTGGQEEE
ncbi:ABC transporter ATP-binding protein [Mumia sp. zg.B53]|uniref:ABC transporter ATP-binding protein n=1 Tax=unclassified Mumia TaxID=2621872 RepID=UPI001C6F0928|nr:MULTISPECIES: ABC transporter ATP-binding protein [unclassified Mumia]MBW9209187.1 ABC transporter ATP-binding protein [Mumia sp. zg.B21]MBW9213797.1 ABC transporter ATP-binding protein [Mumia sp. zg.B53]MDD9347377.1 ABC transporter ATP-binding protein [Mumia sp.]